MNFWCVKWKYVAYYITSALYLLYWFDIVRQRFNILRNRRAHLLSAVVILLAVMSLRLTGLLTCTCVIIVYHCLQRCSPCRATTSWWQRRCSSCTTTRRDMDPSSPVCRRRSAGTAPPCGDSSRLPHDIWCSCCCVTCTRVLLESDCRVCGVCLWLTATSLCLVAARLFACLSSAIVQRPVWLSARLNGFCIAMLCLFQIQFHVPLITQNVTGHESSLGWQR